MRSFGFIGSVSFFLCKQAITLKPAGGKFNTLTKPGKTGQRCTRVYSGTQGYTGVYKGIQGYKEVTYMYYLD